MIAGFPSCKKLVDVDAPYINQNAENIFSTDAAAVSVLTGLYSRVSASTSFAAGLDGTSLLCGLSADELTLYSGVANAALNGFYKNELLGSGPLANVGGSYWEDFYRNIFKCNSAIEGLEKSTTLSSGVKQQLLGEAKCMRAWFHFLLISLYGDAPLVTTTDYKINNTMSRTSKEDVYQQIFKDLKEAQGLLNDQFVDADMKPYGGAEERVRPTKWLATALLAKAYLYHGDYALAEAEATTVINNTALFSLTSLDNAFLKNSKEAIWQLQPVTTGHNTEDGWVFKLPDTGPSSPYYPVYLSPQLISAFELADQRREKWIDSVIVGTDTYYYPYKYKSATLDAPVTEYQMMFRLGEQYLIRAEARTQQSNLGGAIADLDMIRQRAGLHLIANTNPSISQSALLDTILHERQVELFTESGNRWLDLKRTGKANAVMSLVTPLKGGSWQTTDQLYPLPYNDILRNSNLKQNPGY
jgi:hypothetical protein